MIENPWTAAQKFLEANELSLTYVDEVVRFIEKNTAGVAIGTGGEAYNDPFTGIRASNTFHTLLLKHDQVHHDTNLPAVLCRCPVVEELIHLLEAHVTNLPTVRCQCLAAVGELIHSLEAHVTSRFLPHLLQENRVLTPILLRALLVINLLLSLHT